MGLLTLDQHACIRFASIFVKQVLVKNCIFKVPLTGNALVMYQMHGTRQAIDTCMYLI
jgi:hypothetical protein